MSRSFSPTAWRARLAALGPGRLARDPRVLVRMVLGVLLGALLAAGYFVLRPLGGSPEELDRQAQAIQSEIRQHRAASGRLQLLKVKATKAKDEGDHFLDSYFMDRRTASSTIVSELNMMARESGIRPKDHTFTYEPIEGSDTLTMMVINGNYEGTYADLVHYINRLDHSPRFIVIDQMSAAPQSASNTLTVQMKLYTFVKEGGTPADAEERLKRAEAEQQPKAAAPQVAPRPAPLAQVAPIAPAPPAASAPVPRLPIPVQLPPGVAAANGIPMWQGPPDQAPDGTNYRPLRPGGPRRRLPVRTTEEQ